jgi:hypothetical protein
MDLSPFAVLFLYFPFPLFSHYTRLFPLLVWFLEKNADWVTFSVEDYRVALLSWRGLFVLSSRGKGCSMRRTVLSLGVVAALLAAAGCRMCCHPYDHCGPVYDGNGCQSCSSQSRAGSILSGASEIMPSAGLARRPVQGGSVSYAPAEGQVQGQSATFTKVGGRVQGRVQGQVRLGDVPGSERIVSVTDRVVEPSTASSDAPQVAAETSTEPAKPLPVKGWTARRPAPEVQR